MNLESLICISCIMRMSVRLEINISDITVFQNTCILFFLIYLGITGAKLLKKVFAYVEVTQK